MTGCEPYGVEVGAYRDGELALPVRADFEAHLAGCAACRDALEAHSWLHDEIGALPALSPSPQFEARFWARIAREEDRPAGLWARLWQSLSPRLGWALGATALAAVAIVLSLDDPALSSRDWEIVADAEQFELLAQGGDLELLAALDVLEDWDGSEEI